jgi:hypothetical protein
MQAEAVRIGAQLRSDFLTPAVQRSQAEHLLSGTRPKGDAIGVRGSLQRSQRAIHTDICQLGHALLVNQMALAGAGVR